MQMQKQIRRNTRSTNEGPRRRFADIGVSSLFVHGRVAPRHNRRRSYRYLTLYGTTLKVSKRADTSGRITYTSALASRMHVSSARLPACLSFVSIYVVGHEALVSILRSGLLATRLCSKRQPPADHPALLTRVTRWINLTVSPVSLPGQHISDCVTHCRKYGGEECGLEERGSGTVNRWTSRG